MELGEGQDMAVRETERVSWWIKVIAILAPMTLLFFTAEIFLRLTFDAKSLCPPYYALNELNRVPRFEPHPFLPYTGLADDTRTLHWQVEDFGEFVMKYHNNSYGFLGDDFQFEKQPEEIRILTFGGSTTWGMGLDRATRVADESNTWPSILKRMLARKMPQYKWTVYNLAQDAFSSPMSVVNLAFLGVNLLPDFVLSYDGINDMAQTFDFAMRTDYANRFSHFSRYRSIGLSWPSFVLRSRLVCGLVNQIDRRLGYGANTDAFGSVLPPPRLNAFQGSTWNSATLKNVDLLERNLKTMHGISKEYNAVFIGATLHYFTRDDHRDQLNHVLRTFYDREHIPYCDADRLLPKGDKEINTDEVHFTKEGTGLMAKCFADVISRQIQGVGR